MVEEERPFPEPKRGSCLTLGNELSKETHVLTKQEILLGRGPQGQRAGGSGNPAELLCHVVCSLGFYGDGISFQVISDQSLWLRVLPGGTCIAHPRWMSARILGGDRICGVTFWPFPNSSSWWWLISSMFLTRTSCLKTTHANGYCGAWPGWAVSVSVLTLT